jgi:hypothetical protein
LAFRGWRPRHPTDHTDLRRSSAKRRSKKGLGGGAIGDTVLRFWGRNVGTWADTRRPTPRHYPAPHGGRADAGHRPPSPDRCVRGQVATCLAVGPTPEWGPGPNNSGRISAPMPPRRTQSGRCLTHPNTPRTRHPPIIHGQAGGGLVSGRGAQSRHAPPFFRTRPAFRRPASRAEPPTSVVARHNGGHNTAPRPTGRMGAPWSGADAGADVVSELCTAPAGRAPCLCSQLIRTRGFC